MEETLELLANMPVFGGVDRATLEFIWGLAERVHVAEGDAFFREGEKSQAMYVLTAGRVGIYKSWHDTSTLLRYLDPGDCFGEMALIDLQPRSASVVAEQAAAAIEITAAMLHEVYQRDLEQFTLLQMNMGREVSRRLRDCVDTLFRVQMGDPWPDEPIVQNPT